MTVRKASQQFTNILSNLPEHPQYHLFTSEEDEKKIIESLLMLERFFPDYVVMLCNHSHPKLQWVSANCQHIFGITDKAFMNLAVAEFFDAIHPEDLSQVQKCFDFISTSEPYDPISYRFVMYYRYRKADGEYIHLRDEKLAIETEGKYIYFTMFKDVSNEEKFFNVKLDVMRMSKGQVVKVYTYNPRQTDQSITPRQNDIARLMIHGLTNQEIAHKLNVSVYTVKNHKRALFRKVNVKTSVQLVNLYAAQMS